METENTAQGWHFFASSQFEWRTDANLTKLLKGMNRDPYPYNLFYVPLPADAEYKIKHFAPVVEGTIFLGQFPLPADAEYKIKHFAPVVEGTIFLGQYQRDKKK